MAQIIRGVYFGLALACFVLRAQSAPAVNPLQLGATVFHARWLPATGHEAPGEFSGLGPFFQAASCVTCHAPQPGALSSFKGGIAPATLVVQLANAAESGDPVYGHILTTSAVEGLKPEGAVLVEYEETYGYYYPDGGRWRLRVPTYRLVRLAHGPMSPATVIKPRVPPPLFGLGLLESAFSGQSSGRTGLFGWQESTGSIREQSIKALALEMGVTADTPFRDDCSVSEPECQAASGAEQPEITAAQLDSLVAYVRSLTVPASPHRYADTTFGRALFHSIGCTVCHQTDTAAYTDMRLHDLGSQMADETAAGKKVPSRWRTAPLWGLGARTGPDGQATLLHDGRARSAEEAILWHGGEASRPRARFRDLGPRSRRAVLHFLDSL